MSDPEKKFSEPNTHNVPNTGLPQTGFTNRRGRAVVEIETGATGEGGRLPGMTREYSGWDVYNNEAKKVDTELVNDWRDSLNSLLLFAAIFAAVLTAFIIESKKMLEQDPTTVMMDAMIFYINSVANGTHTPYTLSNFHPESYAVKVNCLFFASLSTSLVAALASVVALQWVADYDAAITRGGSSPEDRAKRRQFRHAGAVWWKMGEIIAALPLLLYCSVILFFGGLALWMWEVNNVVGLVVLGGTALATLFYGTSTFLSVAFVSAPFRTPLGRWIYSSTLLFFSFIYHLSAWLRIPRFPVWLQKKTLISAISRRREDQEVERRPDMGITALVWLANQLSVSQDSYDRFLLLTGELPKLKREISSFSGFLEAPWFLIFDLVGWKNLRHIEDESVTSQDIAAFGVLAQCYRIPKIHEIIRPTTRYVTDASDDEYWSQYCDVTEGQWAPQPSTNHPNSLFLLLRDIPLPSTDIEIEIELTIRLSQWRNSPQIALNASDVLSLDIASSIPSTSLTNESIVNEGTYPKADDFPLWISRDDEALYAGIVRQMMSTLGAHGAIPPGFLDALRWRFEAVLVGTDKVDRMTCLSTPTQYHLALQSSSMSLQSFHHAFALLLARNLNSFVGDERVFRFKEILIMLWASPLGRNVRGGGNEVGMERFFEANKRLVMGWIGGCWAIPYIHEILGYLGVAQAEEPKIGPLWRVIPLQAGDSPRLIDALFAFDSLISREVTPQQHRKLIDLVCQDLALGPHEAFKGHFTYDILRWINNLQDPCLRLLVQSYAGSGGDSFHLPSLEIDGPLRNSWARIAAYFVTYPKGTNFPFLLRLQGLLWPVLPNKKDLCSTALKNPSALTHLQRIFEYTVACWEHCDSICHLLLHLLDDVYIRAHVDLTVHTAIPIRGRSMGALLLLMILPDNHYKIPPDDLRVDIHPECLARILEIGKAIRSSQFSSLIMLSQLPAQIIRNDLHGDEVCSEELAGMSIGVTNALHLTSDPRVALVIPDLVSGIRDVKESMHRRNYRPEENLTADKEATIAVNNLMTHLAGMRIFGGRNCGMLACARSRESHSPAVGWLGILKD